MSVLRQIKVSIMDNETQEMITEAEVSVVMKVGFENSEYQLHSEIPDQTVVTEEGGSLVLKDIKPIFVGSELEDGSKSINLKPAELWVSSIDPFKNEYSGTLWIHIKSG